MKKINITEIPLKTVFLLSLALLVLSAAGYWKYIVNDPDRIFEGMLKNSLQTKSVTKIVEEESEGSKSKQTIAVKFAPSLGVVSKYDLSRENGDQKIATQTSVIGLKNADFIKYNSIVSDQVSEAKKREIEGVWAKVGGESEGQKPSVYNDALFSVILFGDLGDNEANEVIKQLIDKDVYSIEKYSTGFSGGRLVSNISVNVKPKNLVEAMKYYGDKTGYVDTDQLDLEGLNNEPITLDLTVDLVSRQTTKISYSGGQRVEQYGAYGQYDKITVPQNAIPFSELSRKLSTQ